ncbi:MAG: aminopeptidase P family protein [Desulfobacteraceae bacterium]|nr:MAG: aminopeptidase P family protein [Desulfobacteraceae bacterium]
MTSADTHTKNIIPAWESPMDSIISSRIDKLRQHMDLIQLDTFLVLIEENRRYLSGYTGEDTQFDESAGALIITRDHLILATDSRFVTQAKAESPMYEVICYQKGLIKELTKILKDTHARQLGIEGTRMSHSMFVKLRDELKSQNLSVNVQDTVHMVERQRVIKTNDEIDAIQKAIAVAESDFRQFLQELRPGMTESQAAWRLEQKMRTAGAQSLSFPVISAFGTNSALPHAIPGEKILKKGDPLLFDWGARLNGYCSDMTRTVCMGTPDSQFKKIFTIVYDAQQKAIDAILPGASSRSIDARARDHISGKGYGDFFGHGLGHGVGLAVHEPPSISPMAEKDIILEENMVFTVEPGIYLPEWGGVRLENMVVVRKEGAQVLNRLEMKLDLMD